MSKHIDACVEYIEAKNCFYLAKEGCIVYFDSLTGRKSDYIWHRQSISETLRIVYATRLSTHFALKQDSLIAAFQEQGRVYEFGVSSRHKVKEGIFNYSEHADYSLGDEIMSHLVAELLKLGFSGVLMNQASTAYSLVLGKLKYNITNGEHRDLQIKHFEAAGFIFKTGSTRVLFEGKKENVIVLPGTKPSDITRMTREVCDVIANNIYEAVK